MAEGKNDYPTTGRPHYCSLIRPNFVLGLAGTCLVRTFSSVRNLPRVEF